VFEGSGLLRAPWLARPSQTELGGQLLIGAARLFAAEGGASDRA